MQTDFLEMRLRQAIVRLFGEMDTPMLLSVRAFFEWVDLRGGACLFHQGDEGDSLYVLAGGRLKVERRDEAGEVVRTAEIAAGETVGEMALLTGEPRSADIHAMRDCVLARISKEGFDRLAELYPRALINISKTVIGRLRENPGNERPSKRRVTNLCILPVSETVAGGEFARALCEMLSEQGSVLLLDTFSVNEFFRQEGISQVSRSNSEAYRRLTAWLEEQESLHRFVVYLADRDESPWTKRCLRQADEILLLADAEQSPELSAVERRYLYGATPISVTTQTLVLLHPTEKGLPVGTGEWLVRRRISLHHHLRPDHAGDMARLARFIGGKAVGLVLSGGAAKGFAHIGVFRALEEAGVPIDFVGGTSIGAIIGALIARGWDGETIRNRCREVFKKNPTSDFNLVPRVSIFKGKKLEQLLHENFDGLQIEDCRLNFFCMSCNLSKNAPFVHRAGNVFEALRASISIPGVFPPAEMNNDLFVDGGVFNNMPVDVMNQMGVGALIAVDLQVHRQEGEADAYRKRKLPNLLFVVMESSMLSGRYHAQEYKKQVDLYFNPPLRGFSLIDWHKFDLIEDTGFQHAQTVLKKWAAGKAAFERLQAQKI